MRARFDVSGNNPTFGFYEWLIQARGLGCETVSFDLSNLENCAYPVEHAMERFCSICFPGPALAGMKVGFGYGLEVARQGNDELVRYFASGKPFKRFESPNPPSDAEYTVTLRKTVKGRQSLAYRDSDEPLWRGFAEKIGARVIEDYEVNPLHLYERLSLYAGAKMNFFTMHGLGVFCSLTPYPMMMFNVQDGRKEFQKQGVIPPGGQYPWLLKNQKMIWEKATSESLMRHFNHWKEKGEFAMDNYAA